MKDCEQKSAAAGMAPWGAQAVNNDVERAGGSLDTCTVPAPIDIWAFERTRADSKSQLSQSFLRSVPHAKTNELRQAQCGQGAAHESCKTVFVSCLVWLPAGVTYCS